MEKEEEMSKGTEKEETDVLKTLYWFPIAATADHHKFSDLKQPKSITLPVGRSEVQNQLYWGKVRCSRACSFWRL